MDSAIALAYLGAVNVRALAIDYGQTHFRELEAARAIAKLLRVSFRLASVRAVLAGALVDGSVAELATERAFSPAMVPGRNMIFLSLAAAYAGSVGADQVWIGACADDREGFPDCRHAFFRAAENALALGLGTGLRINEPLLHMDKKQLVEFARTIPKAWDSIALSWSCYHPRSLEGVSALPVVLPCLECGACLARARGFAEAGETDPAVSP